MIDQNTPRTEAPPEMNTYFPEHEALWMAENVVSAPHDIYTLRGAPARDPLRWSKDIARALFKLGLDAEDMFPRTAGRAGATNASRKRCVRSATSTPTGATSACTA